MQAFSVSLEEWSRKTLQNNQIGDDVQSSGKIISKTYYKLVFQRPKWFFQVGGIKYYNTALVNRTRGQGAEDGVGHVQLLSFFKAKITVKDL